MRYISVCSGIEAASVAWHPLGWRAAAFSEIEPFPSAVLAHHWPEVPNLGDMKHYADWPRYDAVDLLCGGTPCQSFSHAGLRQGLRDPRGNLTLTFLAVAARYMPRWIVWENVPGILSDKGNAFGCFLAGLSELGYGWAYRVLDAQYFGVPQRRRRVFVVAHLGDWRRAAAVLFERESLRGDIAPSREAGQNVAPTISARTKGGLGTDFDCDGGLTAESLTARPYSDRGSDGNLVCMATGQAGAEVAIDQGPTPTCNHEAPILAFQDRFRGDDGRGYDRPPPCSVDHTGTLETVKPWMVAFKASHFTRGKDGAPSEVAPPLSADADKGDQDTLVMAYRTSGNCGAWETGDKVDALTTGTDPSSHLVQCFQPRVARNGRGAPSDIAPALAGADAGATSDMRPCIFSGMAVRRLTPREYERLQGFTDDYTRVPYRGKAAADGPRYKAIGNSWAVPVVRWIGQRIELVDSL